MNYKEQPRVPKGSPEGGQFLSTKSNTSFRVVHNKMVSFPLSFFEDLSRQTNRQIRKGIRTKLRVIERHKYKIKNPHTVYPEWDSFSEERKHREIKHWLHEIATHEKEIAEREKILEERIKEG